MVLQHAVEAFEQAVVRDEQQWLEPMPLASVTTASSSSSGSSGTVECLELADRSLHLLHPARVQLVPVPVVVAAAPREKLGPAGSAASSVTEFTLT